MNDHNLSLYILPICTNSTWNFLFEAHDAPSLHRAISRRPINEAAFFTVYADPDNWLTLGSRRHHRFDALTIKSHLISSSKAEMIWQMALSTRNRHINFHDDMLAVRDRFFSIDVKRAFCPVL